MMKTEWRGFKGNLWQSEVNLVTSFRTTTLATTAMSRSWQNLLRQPTPFGEC